jgi:hypothetical protein
LRALHARSATSIVALDDVSVALLQDLSYDRVQRIVARAPRR